MKMIFYEGMYGLINEKMRENWRDNFFNGEEKNFVIWRETNT